MAYLQISKGIAWNYKEKRNIRETPEGEDFEYGTCVKLPNS